MITVNKRHKLPWKPGLTIRDVLTAMHYTFTHIVVAMDGALVRHDAYDTTTIPDGADVHVVHLMAGG